MTLAGCVWGGSRGVPENWREGKKVYGGEKELGDATPHDSPGGTNLRKKNQFGRHASFKQELVTNPFVVEKGGNARYPRGGGTRD